MIPTKGRSNKMDKEIKPIYWELRFSKTEEVEDADERVIVQTNDLSWKNGKRGKKNRNKNAQYFFMYLMEQKAAMGYNTFIREVVLNEDGEFVPGSSWDDEDEIDG